LEGFMRGGQTNTDIHNFGHYLVKLLDTNSLYWDKLESISPDYDLLNDHNESYFIKYDELIASNPGIIVSTHTFGRKLNIRGKNIILVYNEDIDVILSLLTPYIMYIIAEEVHASGVMAVVCGGLYLAYHNIHILSSSSRIRGINVWHSFTFLLNGLVFLLIGLGLPDIVEGLKKDGISLYDASIYGVLVTVVLIVVRLLASYGAVIVTKVMSNFITVADPKINLKAPFIIGWSGMRGVVSLAAALSIPLTLEDGTPFPNRSLILYITFVAIFVTLVFQGLTLPFITLFSFLPLTSINKLYLFPFSSNNLVWDIIKPLGNFSNKSSKFSVGYTLSISDTLFSIHVILPFLAQPTFITNIQPNNIILTFFNIFFIAPTNYFS